MVRNDEVGIKGVGRIKMGIMQGDASVGIDHAIDG